MPGLLVSGIAALVLVVAGRAGADPAPPPPPQDALQPAFHDLAAAGDIAAETRQLLAATPLDAQTVFPPDNRLPVDDTTKAPWRSITLLGAFDSNDNMLWSCTGSLVNYNVVLTAAHCLYENDYVYSMLVIPGAAPPSRAPFGSATAYRFAVPKGWARTQDNLYDFGLIFLHGSPFKNLAAPYLTVAAASDDYFNSPDVLIASAGYPGDKPAFSMWFSASFAFWVDSQLIHTRMDAYAGQSGSPIYALDERTNDVDVVGVYSAETRIENLAVRFTPDHLTALQDYCAPEGCTVATRLIGLSGGSTPAPVPGSHSATLSPGTNTVTGPANGDVIPARFMSCVPSTAWQAIYVWQPGDERWLSYFGPGAPPYVNEVPGARLTTIPRDATVTVLMAPSWTSRQADFPDSTAAACPPSR